MYKRKGWNVFFKEDLFKVFLKLSYDQENHSEIVKMSRVLVVLTWIFCTITIIVGESHVI